MEQELWQKLDTLIEGDRAVAQGKLDGLLQKVSDSKDINRVSHFLSWNVPEVCELVITLSYLNAWAPNIVKQKMRKNNPMTNDQMANLLVNRVNDLVQVTILHVPTEQGNKGSRIMAAGKTKALRFLLKKMRGYCYLFRGFPEVKEKLDLLNQILT